MSLNQFFNPLALSLLSGLIVLALSSFFLMMLKTTRVYKGFGYWAISTATVGVGTLLIGLRSIMPDFFTLILSNGLIIFGLIVMKKGYCDFFNVKNNSLLVDGSILFLYFLLQNWFTYIDYSINVRSLIVSLCFAVIFYYCTRIMIVGKVKLSSSGSTMLLYLSGFNLIFSLFRSILSFCFIGRNLENSVLLLFGIAVLLQIISIILTFFAMLLCNAQRIELELTGKIKKIKTLEGILPICCHCHKIRDDDSGGWEIIEKFVNRKTDASFSHSICPECMQKHYPEVTDV